MIEKFEKWLQTQGWIVTVNKRTNLELNDEFMERYLHIGNEYEEFLKYFEKVVSADETTWFICRADYNNISDCAFRWNEFEQLSLEAAEDDVDWQNEIKQWWDKKIPILISVGNGYSFYAIDIENDSYPIVRGEEPEFEETEMVANSFYEFLDMIMSGEAVAW